MITDWKSDLYKERSLHAVFRASKTLPKSPHNKFIYAVTGMGIVSVMVGWIESKDVAGSAHGAVVAAEIAFDLAVQILGFLIGGFAIFATVTDDRLMIRLAQAPMGDDSGLSVFKNVFFNFLSVFYIYIGTLSFGLTVKLLHEVKVFELANIILTTSNGSLLLAVLNSLAFGGAAAFLILAIVRLKSFIWNIYQAFITFLAVSEMMERQEGADASPRAPDIE